MDTERISLLLDGRVINMAFSHRTDVISRVAHAYIKEAPAIMTKRCDRRLRGEKPSPSSVRESPRRKQVHFDCSSLISKSCEALNDEVSDPDCAQDWSHYVYSVRDNERYPKKVRDYPREVELAPSLTEEDTPLIRRVICSVGGATSVSPGFICDVPMEMLIDTGATYSLISWRALCSLGRSSAVLTDCEGSLKGVSGHHLRTKGVISLPTRLGSLELTRPFVVVEDLHIDVILGTDTLKAYKAVIDTYVHSITLKDTGESLLLGAPRIEALGSVRQFA